MYTQELLTCTFDNRERQTVRKKSTVTPAITLSNVMRSADIIMLQPHTETPNPHKPSRCSETQAPTVKENNLFHYLSSQCGMDQTQQTAAQLYGSVPHRACVNTRHLATGRHATHTAITVPYTGMVLCVCAYRLPPVPEGRVDALDLISSLCSAVCKRLKYQSFSQSTAPGRASCSTGNTEGDGEDRQEKTKTWEMKARKAKQKLFKTTTS